MLDFKNSNIVFVAPQTTILNQFQNHIIKNILKRRDVQIKEYSKVIEEAFPHLKMFCYDTISSKDEQWIEALDADFIILDELHRAGAKTWQPQIKKLIDNNPSAKILGMTATPIRDMDNKDMTREIAKMTGDYTEEELLQKKHLVSEMYLLDAMQNDIVISPKIVTFDYTLKETQEYQEIIKMIEEEKDPDKKVELNRIYKEMNAIIKNSEKEGINKIFEENIRKKNGRYIVFLPNNNTELSSEKYMEEEIEKVKEYFKGVNPNIKTTYLLSDRERAKVENINALEEFENSDSDELKLIFAINMLNEGVHVNGIDGEIMLRPIGENSKILYQQQIGRCIFSLDPEKPILEEEKPIIFDVYNNYLAQGMDREANKTNPTSDLQRLQLIVNWIERHKGYIPDINSENIKEAKKAVSLKNIQKKYGGYLTGINNKNLSESEIYEIQEILELGKSIELWDLDIPDRIIPPGERDVYRNDTFKVIGTQKEFIDLFKDAKRLTKDRELSSTLRIKDTISILEVLSEYGIEISNETISIDSNLGDILKDTPEEKRRAILEEIENDEKFELGKEYNFVKKAFGEGKKSFLQYDIKELRKYGIFESFVNDKYYPPRVDRVLTYREFIGKGPEEFEGINIKTGTNLDERGYDVEGYDTELFREGATVNKYGFDRDGYYYEEKYGEFIKTSRREDPYGFIKDGTWKDTGRIVNPEGFNAKHVYCKLMKNGKFKPTNKKRDPEGFDINGLNEYGFDRDGYYYEKENGEYINTGKKINPYGFNIDGYYCEEKNGEYISTGKKEDPHGFKIDRTWQDTGKKLNPYHFDINGNYWKTTKRGNPKTVYGYINPYGFNIDGYYCEEKNGEYINTGKKEGPDGFKIDGTFKDTGKRFNLEGYRGGNINGYGFDMKGYYWKETAEGKYINTGLRYNGQGFRKDGKNIITKTVLDIRGFDFYKKYSGNVRKEYDENGFRYDGRHKDTGELYYNGYNAFGINQNGKDKNGNEPNEISFTKEYVKGVLKGNPKEVLEKHGVKDMEKLNLMIYTAGEMYPKIKQVICEKIIDYKNMIKEREEKIKQLDEKQDECKQELGKIQKEIEILRKRIRLMNPMQDMEK